MSIKIPHARKKRKQNMKLKNPLPIPFALDVDKDENPLTWPFYTGSFKYGAVIIHEKAHAQALWENGFFGDGNLSTCGMNHNSNVKTNLKSKHDLKGGDFNFTSQDQKPFMEVLHLCLEEALFLSYALGTLILTNEEENEMDIDDMWTAFCKLNPQFPLQYAVYHHFRCKGWVVKPGIKFGADWTLYPVGPPFYHSQYLVWVQCLWEDTLEEDSSLSFRRSKITDISALERLSGHVSKSVLLCQVLRPRQLTDNVLKSIECLQGFTMSDVVLQRWSATSEPSCKPDLEKHCNTPKGAKRSTASTSS